jgi:hypothetical protein
VTNPAEKQAKSKQDQLKITALPLSGFSGGRERCFAPDDRLFSEKPVPFSAFLQLSVVFFIIGL